MTAKLTEMRYSNGNLDEDNPGRSFTAYVVYGTFVALILLSDSVPITFSCRLWHEIIKPKPDNTMMLDFFASVPFERPRGDLCEHHRVARSRWRTLDCRPDRRLPVKIVGLLDDSARDDWAFYGGLIVRPDQGHAQLLGDLPHHSKTYSKHVELLLPRFHLQRTGCSTDVSRYRTRDTRHAFTKSSNS